MIARSHRLAISVTVFRPTKIVIARHQVSHARTQNTGTMGSIGQSERTYPLKKPKDHKPPVPRWSLRFPDIVTHIYTLYIGVQCHRQNIDARKRAEQVIDSLLSSHGSDGPITDTFRVTNGFDLDESKVWVAYWTKKERIESVMKALDLQRLWNQLGHDKQDVGLWCEHFITPLERLETNYSRLDHKPGLAQLPDTTQPAHEITAYWGAGRDRIPASAHDLFPTAKDARYPSSPPQGLGERLTGTNYDNMCHIRSGQWWEKCNDEERMAYEGDLQITLMQGMNYLWQHPEETGTIGLRFLQNLDDTGSPIKETCGAGFHRNWSDLEKWSSRHPSHLAIFNGAMKHAKRFGEDRKFMTWHEVSILRRGDAHFEYVNCDPRTGVIKWVELERHSLNSKPE